ncbi:MAG: class I SAM-dependent methyltransferase [Mangrovicoccus sp.]
MSDPSKFWTKLAPKYAKMAVRNPEAYDHKLSLLRGLITDQDQIVEIGCGTGSTAITLAPLAGHYIAADYAQGMIDIANQKKADAGLENLNFHCTDWTELDLAPNSQDKVFAMSILHLLPQPEKAVAEAWRLLKPGGIFASSTICLKDCYRFMAPIIPVATFFGFFPYIRRMSKAQLSDLVTAPGFEIREEYHPGPKEAVFLVAQKPLS